MRVTPRTKCAIFGFLLAGGISFILPDLAFSAGRSIRRSPKFRVPAVHRLGGFTRPLTHSGFLQNKSGFLDNKSGIVFVDRVDRLSRPFHKFPFPSGFHTRFGFASGFSGGQVFVGDSVVIIQQLPFSATSHATEPPKNRTYVDPQWVDGGHGVEVLKSGYWTDAR